MTKRDHETIELLRSADETSRDSWQFLEHIRRSEERTRKRIARLGKTIEGERSVIARPAPTAARIDAMIASREDRLRMAIVHCDRILASMDETDRRIKEFSRFIAESEPGIGSAFVVHAPDDARPS